MARYLTQVHSPKPAAEVFGYLADLSNMADWDPGVIHVEQLQGSGSTAGAVFDVVVKTVGGSVTFRYCFTNYDAPIEFTVCAQKPLLTSIDRVAVAEVGDGSVVTYSAELKFSLILKVLDPVLGFVLKRIGDRASVGLVRELEGQRW